MSLSRRDGRSLPLLLVALGTAVRLLYWALYPPIYKLHAVFTPIDSSALAYVADFQSYMAVRMPFYDVFAAALYVPLAGLLGVEALSAFAVLASVASLPVFYLAVSRLFDERTATYALVFYALYPKFVVLAAQGFPEAASVSFLVASLYAVARGLPDRRVLWLGVAGTFALLAYLTFIPSVAVGVLFALWLYVDGLEEADTGWSRFVPDRAFVAYSSLPGVVGVLYLAFGPLRQSTGVVSGSWSNMASSLFVHSYGLIERVVRYLSYAYFDFWWHFRGYDKEDGILRILDSLQAFLGPIFPLYAVGWLAITLAFSALVVLGLSRLLRDRSLPALVVAAWVLLFVLLYNVRNWGWTGVFQTRHVFSIFPAVCIAFGRGGDLVAERVSSSRGLLDRTNLSVRTVGVAVLSVCFLVLLVNGAVEGTMIAQNHQLSKERPVAELQGIVEGDETVAVATRWDYYDVVTHSESAIRPTIVAATPDDAALFRNWTVLADVQHVDPAAISSANADYFYAAHCGDWRPRQERYLEALNRSGARIAHQETIDRGPGKCTVRTIVVELPDG